MPSPGGSGGGGVITGELGRGPVLYGSGGFVVVVVSPGAGAVGTGVAKRGAVSSRSRDPGPAEDDARSARGAAAGARVVVNYRGNAAALLLDTFVPGKAGGTSQTFHWQSIGEVPGWAPLFIAGGLNPDNVAQAVGILRPYAVDVSSGVESSPGIKDHHKIEVFCAAVREADRKAHQ